MILAIFRKAHKSMTAGVISPLLLAMEQPMYSQLAKPKCRLASHIPITKQEWSDILKYNDALSHAQIQEEIKSEIARKHNYKYCSIKE